MSVQYKSRSHTRLFFYTKIINGSTKIAKGIRRVYFSCVSLMYSVWRLFGAQGPDAEQFDGCHGHPAMNGNYHYHELPGLDCMFHGNHVPLDDGYGTFLGVALDGFAIYYLNATYWRVTQTLPHYINTPFTFQVHCIWHLKLFLIFSTIFYLQFYFNHYSTNIFTP